MKILESPRLWFRHLQMDDLQPLYALYRDPEVRRYFPEGTLTLAETREELEWFLNGHPRHPELGLWATIHKQSGQFIGRCGLLPWTLDGRDEVEIAYLIDPAYWGQGLATEAARAIRDYAFERLGLRRLVCLIDAGNVASKRVAEKIGMHFEREGEDEKGPYLLYSMERTEPAQRALWDAAATTFDAEPDHGLHEGPVLAAWTTLLRRWLPGAPVRVLDVGCGTGSLSRRMAQLGHHVTGIDFSAAMVARAQAKAREAQPLAGTCTLVVMDAADPSFAAGSFDVLVCRHVLWTLPDWKQVLQRWARLLRAGGRLLLVEGFWETGAGLHAQEVLDALPDSLALVAVERLDGEAAFWGKEVNDERYLIVAQCKARERGSFSR